MVELLSIISKVDLLVKTYFYVQVKMRAFMSHLYDTIFVTDLLLINVNSNKLVEKIVPHQLRYVCPDKHQSY